MLSGSKDCVQKAKFLPQKFFVRLIYSSSANDMRKRTKKHTLIEERCVKRCVATRN